MDTPRQLVTIRTVSDLLPIPGADLIEVAQVDGWKCVVKKGDFRVGDMGVYFEIDSILPCNKPQFDFLTKGVKPHRLKTIRLRKQLSQGLLVPLNQFPELLDDAGKSYNDLAGILGVIKYDPDPPAAFREPLRKGFIGWVQRTFPWFFRKKKRPLFPSFLRKTDQERIQNCIHEVLSARRFGTVYEVTEKLDGSSMTLFNNGKRTGVCSRNLELDPKKNPDNHFVRMYLKYLPSLKDIPGYAIQGEIVGPGIQGNKYGLRDFEFYVFDVFNIETQKYLTPDERRELLKRVPEFDHVAVVRHWVQATTLDIMLKEADGGSNLNANVAREGLVWKSMSGDFSFKVISNAWLEKNE
jgi:hypothetical protein